LVVDPLVVGGLGPGRAPEPSLESGPVIELRQSDNVNENV